MTVEAVGTLDAQSVEFGAVLRELGVCEVVSGDEGEKLGARG